MRIAVLLAAGSAIAVTSVAMGSEITRFDFDSNVVGGRNLSFVNPFDGAFFSAGDGSQVYQRGVSATIPFAILDDTLSFPTDSGGIVKTTKTDAFFGVTDTVNNDNLSGDVNATWTFDVSGFSAMTMFIDMAAMGDFEASDVFTFSVDIDGGGFTTIFSSSVNELGSATYTMEDGTTRTLFDPMSMNGVQLTNDFHTIVSAIAGSGSVLTLRFDGNTNGGSEAFAFDTIVLRGVPTPGALALFGLGGLAAARRRRA